MKKILLLISLIASFLVTFGQPEANRQTGASNTLVDQAVFVTRNFRPPIFNDTTQANTQYPVLDSTARLIYTRDVNGYWGRVNHRWVRVGNATSIQGSNSILVSGNGDQASPFIISTILSPQNNNSITSTPTGLLSPTFVSNGIIDGLIVTHVSGYTYDVSPGRYAIGGVVYTYDGGQVTLPASDTLPRIDQIFANTSQQVSVTAGTPSETPQEPNWDATTQLPVRFIFVDSNSIAPPVNEELIYINNAEWTTASSNTGRINPDATNLSFSASKSVRFLLAQNGAPIS